VVDDTQKSFDINVFGVLKTVFAFLPLIKAGGLKKVVAISSGMADIGKSPPFAAILYQ
jgi:NAD(P)-dependent dehydrogenase (short-subunit alcohol dehydrogenase family)